MENIKYWLGFANINGVGSTTILRLYRHFGSIKEAWHAGSSDITEVEGIKRNLASLVQTQRKNVEPDKLLEEVLSKNVRVITYEDENYPYLLKQIYDPPACLFIKGDLETCNLDKTLAVVGSRKASNYIKDVTDKIINGLTGSDITIVSGGAVGVDTCAHTGALNNNLKTIAVLGSGFDNIYPSKNKDLFKKIADGNGAVVTEYYPTCPPDARHFPQRNRIISGLSKGTLIAEAGLKSGALITARLCLEHNRELMCIPGLVTNPNTEGTHLLIKEGAGLVTSASDIFEHLNWQYNVNLDDKNDNFNHNLLDNERKILEILILEPKNFDTILGESELSIDTLMVTLTTLEINGYIKQLPGQMYSKRT